MLPDPRPGLNSLPSARSTADPHSRLDARLAAKARLDRATPHPLRPPRLVTLAANLPRSA